MTPQRITMVTLAVADLAASRAFYARLGFEEAQGGNDKIAFYAVPGQFFALYARDALTSDIGMPISKRATGAITLATNYETADKVMEAYHRALAAGAVPISGPSETDWGGFSAMVADPDGHLWEYAVNPFWTYDDRGAVVGDP